MWNVSHSSAVHLSREQLNRLPIRTPSSPGWISPAPPASLPWRTDPPSPWDSWWPSTALGPLHQCISYSKGPKLGTILQMWSTGRLNKEPQFTSLNCLAVLLLLQPVCCQPSLLQGHTAGSFLARPPTSFSAELPLRSLSMQGVYMPQVQDLTFFLVESDEAPDRPFLCLTCNLHHLFKSQAWASHHHIRG